MQVSALTLLVLVSPLASSGLSMPLPAVWTSSAFRVAPNKDLLAVPDLLVQKLAGAPQAVRSSEFKSSAFAGYPSAPQASVRPVLGRNDGYVGSFGSKAAQSSQQVKVSGHQFGGFEKRGGSRGEDQLTINVNISGVTSQSQPLASTSFDSQGSILAQTSSSPIQTPPSPSMVALAPLATSFGSQTAGLSGSLEITGSRTSSGSAVSTESSQSLGSTGSFDLSLSSQPSASIESSGSSGSSGSAWVDSSSSGSQISGSSISVTSITSSSSSESSSESSEKGNKIFAAYKPTSAEPGFSPSIENPIYTRYIAYEDKKQESSGFPNSVVLVSSKKTSSVERPLIKTGESLS